MKNRMWKKAVLALLVMSFLIMGLGVIATPTTANAQDVEVEEVNLDFVIYANLLSNDKDAFNVEVTIENHGNDWEGWVRLTPELDYQVPTAYDTAISLPKDSTKQFVVKIPRTDLDEMDGTLRIGMVNKKNKVEATKTFQRFLEDKTQGLVMGILSDHYSSLTFLDMGGERFYYQGENKQIFLKDVTTGSFADNLDGLNVLVVDDYDTSVLTQDELQALELWIINGGVLLVGTGSHAEDVLKGFGDLLEVSYVYSYDRVFADVHGNAVAEGTVATIQAAELEDKAYQYGTLFFSEGLGHSKGDGAIGILPYSLADLTTFDMESAMDITLEIYVNNMLDEVTGNSASRYSNANYSNAYNVNYQVTRMLSVFGKSFNKLNFGLLKFIVIIYAIFVGPILYLILMAAKKREMYWIWVPVASVVGIALIFLAGRGFQVKDITAYTVTMQNLGGHNEKEAFIYAYNADLKEWSLKLKDGVSYVGPATRDHHYMDGSEEDLTIYQSHIQKEGEHYYFGVKPTKNFDDSYFKLGYQNDNQMTGGDIICENMQASIYGTSGKITNQSGKDLKYIAVMFQDESMYVYKGMKNGESLDIAVEPQLFQSYQSYNMFNVYVYDMLDDAGKRGPLKKEDRSALAALGVGASAAHMSIGKNNYEYVVVGVVEDVENIIDGNCREVSYGCFYVAK